MASLAPVLDSHSGVARTDHDPEPFESARSKTNCEPGGRYLAFDFDHNADVEREDLTTKRRARAKSMSICAFPERRSATSRRLKVRNL